MKHHGSEKEEDNVPKAENTSRERQTSANVAESSEVASHDSIHAEGGARPRLDSKVRKKNVL